MKKHFLIAGTGVVFLLSCIFLAIALESRREMAWLHSCERAGGFAVRAQGVQWRCVSKNLEIVVPK